MAEVISQEFGGPLLKPLHGLLAMGGGGGGGGWPPSKRIMYIYIYSNYKGKDFKDTIWFNVSDWMQVNPYTGPDVPAVQLIW